MTEELTYDCNDRKTGMTLGEIDDVIHSARRAGAARESRIKIGIGWSQQIQKLTVLVQPNPSAQWPIVTFTHGGREWMLPNLSTAPLGMVAVVHSGDAHDFLEALSSFAGQEFADRVAQCDPAEYEEIMLAWETASTGRE